MRVHFVGSGDAFGSGGRWQTCIHLSGEGQVMLVDCGATSLVALKAQGLDPGAVDAVAVSHLHGDHFGGLPFLILDGQFSRRSAPLQVAGPPGIQTRLAEAMEALFPGSSQARRRFPVEVTELGTDGKAAGLGAATVRGWEVEHACGAPPLALRVELGGTSFAYSGDTQWTAALAKAAHGADLFAVEAYTFDRRSLCGSVSVPVSVAERDRLTWSCHTRRGFRSGPPADLWHPLPRPRGAGKSAYRASAAGIDRPEAGRLAQPSGSGWGTIPGMGWLVPYS